LSFKGWREQELLCSCATTLERNRLIDINKATGVATYSGPGSESAGVTRARSRNNLATIYPIASKTRSFLVKIASDVAAGDLLFPASNGMAVKSSHTVVTSGLKAEPSLSADAVYLVPADATGQNWGGKDNAVALYDNSATGDKWTFIVVDADNNVGLTILDSSTGKYLSWNGTAWVLATPVAYANEAGVSGAEIEAYQISDMGRISGVFTPEGMNFGIVLMGQSASETDADAEVVVSDTRIKAGDVAFVTIADQTGAGDAGSEVLASIVKATCTAGELTITLSGNGGADTVINYMIVRGL
jgi:hypothetical protein